MLIQSDWGWLCGPTTFKKYFESPDKDFLSVFLKSIGCQSGRGMGYMLLLSATHVPHFLLSSLPVRGPPSWRASQLLKNPLSDELPPKPFWRKESYLKSRTFIFSKVIFPKKVFPYSYSFQNLSISREESWEAEALAESLNEIGAQFYIEKQRERLLQESRGYTFVQRKILSQSRLETDKMNSAHPLFNGLHY